MVAQTPACTPSQPSGPSLGHRSPRGITAGVTPGHSWALSLRSHILQTSPLPQASGASRTPRAQVSWRHGAPEHACQLAPVCGGCSAYKGLEDRSRGASGLLRSTCRGSLAPPGHSGTEPTTACGPGSSSAPTSSCLHPREHQAVPVHMPPAGCWRASNRLPYKSDSHLHLLC